MVLIRKPVYVALFAMTLLAVIAGSGAIMALTGKGRDVMIFGVGVGVGMSLVSALSLELWQLSRDRIDSMQETIIRAIAALQLGSINPHLLLSQYGRLRPDATPQNASEINLEIECRRLLDRLRELLDGAVGDDGHCHYCDGWGQHDSKCRALAAQVMYQAGKRKRVVWDEYKKTLPQDVV